MKSKEVQSMEYRIAICDDEEAQREYLVSLVRSWSAEAGVTAKVTAFSIAGASKSV